MSTPTAPRDLPPASTAAPSAASAVVTAAADHARVRRVALVAGLVLAVFLPWSLWVVRDDGLAGLIAVLRAEPWGAQLFVDLVIALTIGCAWIVADAARRGRRAWPFLALTLVSGSIGPLAYLAWRARR